MDLYLIWDPLQARPHLLWFILRFFQGFDDLSFVFGAKTLHGNPKLYRRVSVNAYKLIVLQFYDISLFFCNRIRHFGKLTWLVGQQNRYGKNTVS